MSSSPTRRADNVAAEGPGSLPKPSAASMTTSNPDDDDGWVTKKYANFRGFVRELVGTIPAVRPWADWLDALPLLVFLAGGDEELKDVRAAVLRGDNTARDHEARLVVSRWATLYGFDEAALSPEQLDKLRRYVALFASI